LILGFDSQIKNIDQSMKDKSIAIDHQIKAIEARLDERLDDSLDDSLDNILYENYSEIFVDRLDESLDTSLDTNLDDSLDNTTINGKKHGSAPTHSLREPAKQWLTLKEILSQRWKNWPKSIEGLQKKAIREEWPSRIKKEYQIPYESLDKNLDTNLDTNLDESLDTSLDTNLDDSLDNTTINGKKHGSAPTHSLREPAKQWLTLKEILSQRRKNWPKSIEGLRKKAIREGWPSREIENRKEYQIP
jgi:hypothetical protein